MEMQASRTLAVSQQQAWEALNDPEVLKLCIPGCDKVEPTGENQYSVAMALTSVQTFLASSTPRAIWSRSSDSNSALKLPSPKPSR